MMEHSKSSNLQMRPGESGHEYSSLDICYEDHRRLAWLSMHATPRPCFTLELAHEIQHWYERLKNQKAAENQGLEYIVSTSDVAGAYNLGGDLALFCQLIRNGDRQGLLEYAIACNDILYSNHTGINGEITTIALVQGDALGGGFEAAVSSEVLIAERGAKMGLPDILFNLFPGAGAYSLLSRKIGMVEAERLILGGKLHTAEQMHALGVVDILAEDGQGRQAAYDYIKKESRLRNGYRAFRKAKRCTNPVTYEELLSAASIWVDTAFRLEARDLRMMERLVKRQSARSV
jgi:DSF synthase